MDGKLSSISVAVPPPEFCQTRLVGKLSTHGEGASIRHGEEGFDGGLF